MFGDALQQWQAQINSTRSGPSSFLSPVQLSTNTSLGQQIGPQGMGRAMIRFPAAIPVNLLPLMLRSPEISQDDLNILKNDVFTPDLIGNVIVDYSTFLATFRGQPNISSIDTYER